MPFDNCDTALDESLQLYSKMRQYLRSGRMPWRRERGAVRFIARPGAASAADLELDGRAFSEFVRRRFQDEIDNEARVSLWRADPLSSARWLLSRDSVLRCLAALALFFTLAFVFPEMLIAALALTSSGIFLATALTRCLLVLVPARDSERPPPIPDAALPTITILAPLFREAHSIPGLVDALNQLDYPAPKLDIKLLFEEADLETRREAERLKLDERFDLIVIPAGSPQTKPKACNVGLASALGEFIVIYDAEDEPEPRQLRDAVEKFAAGGPDLACVQARLNFYNHSENWLTRLFTLEYCLWFDHLLPALERLGAPIPLGGTSNMFRTEILREIGAWDPFNVTEDADVGMRLSARGYKTALIDSTTFEEANCQLGNWLRQRSRWMKGFLQTWIVHSRAPDARRDWKMILSLDLFIGGAVFAALASPFLWLLAAADLLGAFSPLDRAPDWLKTFNIFALTMGQAILVALAALAPLKRGLERLAPTALLTPLYWIMIAMAAWRGVIQLLRRPSYWEKTAHGVSRDAGARRGAALAALDTPRERH